MEVEFEDATREVRVHFCIPNAPKGLNFGELSGPIQLYRLDKGGAPSRDLADRFEVENTVFLADKVHNSYLLRLVSPEGEFLSWAPFHPAEMPRVGNWFTGVLSVERGTPGYSPQQVKERAYHRSA